MQLQRANVFEYSVGSRLCEQIVWGRGVQTGTWERWLWNVFQHVESANFGSLAILLRASALCDICMHS